MGEEGGTSPILTRHGPIARIRLNRPRYRNRLEPDDLDALGALLVQIDADPSVRTLILTGEGSVFCSGYHLGDLQDRQPGPAAPDPSQPSAFEAVVNALEDISVPTICRLNGGVYGGGTDLAIACDFRIGTPGVEMFMPAGRLGIHYYPSGMVRFVSRMGPDAARRLFLTAERIPADEMLRIGYLTEIVEAGSLDERVASLASTLAANAPLAVQGMKKTVNAIARGAFDRPAAARRYAESLLGEEVAEGLRAFAEKRTPVFPDRPQVVAALDRK
jgi:enoyl-CoA hydratase